MRTIFVFFSIMLALCCNAQNSNNDTNADGKVSIVDVCNTINKAIEKRNTAEVNAILVKLGNTIEETLGIESRIPEFEDIYINGKEYHIGISGAIDLGISIKWAAYNVGATSTAEYGDYYAWGEIEPYYTDGNSQVSPCTSWRTGKSAGYTWASYFDSVDGTAYNFAKYTTSKKTQLDLQDDVAHVKWSGDWRMPTAEELDELFSLPRVRMKYNGKDGYVIMGENDNAIFIPSAGLWDENELLFVGTMHIWSSSLNGKYSYNAVSKDLGNTVFGWPNGRRYYGQSVRPVCNYSTSFSDSDDDDRDVEAN